MVYTRRALRSGHDRLRELAMQGGAATLGGKINAPRIVAGLQKDCGYHDGFTASQHADSCTFIDHTGYLAQVMLHHSQTR